MRNLLAVALFLVACDSGPVRKRSEAAHYLDQISKQAKVAFHVEDHFLIGRAGPTPAGPCCGQPSNKCPVTTAWKTDPVWSKLEIHIDEPTLYQYTYASDGKTFTLTAAGDLDCDGQPAIWTAAGTISEGNPTSNVTRPSNGTY